MGILIGKFEQFKDQLKKHLAEKYDNRYKGHLDKAPEEQLLASFAFEQQVYKIVSLIGGVLVVTRDGHTLFSIRIKDKEHELTPDEVINKLMKLFEDFFSDRFITLP